MENKKNRDIEYLIHFAKLGSLKRVRFYIEKEGVDANSTNDIGRTALHEAAYHGHDRVVKYLVSKGVHVNHKTECDRPELSGATPLLYAVMMGKINVVKTLIHYGADIKVTLNGLTLLDFAVDSNVPEMLEIVLSWDYNVNQYSASGVTPLIRAFANGCYKSAKFLLERGADYRKYSLGDNLSPLYFVVQQEKENGICIELLLRYIQEQEGKEKLLEHINYNGAEGGRTALHAACFRQRYHGVKILLEYGADTSVKDDKGFVPYDLLSILGDTNVCKQIKSLFQQVREHGK